MALNDVGILISARNFMDEYGSVSFLADFFVTVKEEAESYVTV
jgi:hypothetical protein